MRIPAILALIALATAPARAQERTVSRSLAPLLFIGSAAEDRARLDQLRGLTPSEGWLARTPSSMSDSIRGVPLTVPRLCAVRIGVIPGNVLVNWNSDISFERNDGGVWTGRGTTVAASAGLGVKCGRFTVRAVPQVWHAWNEDFPVVPSGYWRRSDFASPIHSIDQSSADLPVRFGARPITATQFGQSSVNVELGSVVLGASSESEWWGPGIRNGLLMSNNAEGIPRYHVGTARPIRTRAGALSARLISGILTESRFFDRLDVGFDRPLSGLVIALATAADSNLSVGAARVVYRRRTSSRYLPLHALDVLTHWSTRNPSDSVEQLSSLFARWVFPATGLEVYGEWGRVLLPKSLREFLIAPQFTQGYTVGMQWLSRREASMSAWRTQLEFTNLEQLRPVREVSPPSFYTSPVVPHGYTQRGQVIGATIGPGSSSQFLAIDRLGRSWSAGLFGGRIRWQHDEFYAQPSGLSFYAHDVSVYGGARGTHRTRYFDYSAELVAEKRMNFLFQHANHGFGNDRTFDVDNMSLRFAVTPHALSARSLPQ